jgi:hypothetical protein
LRHERCFALRTPEFEHDNSWWANRPPMRPAGDGRNGQEGVMKRTQGLAIAAALGLLFSSSAIAASNNTLYLEQKGTGGNIANIHQSLGVGNNNLGLSGAPLVQDGSGNFLQYHPGTTTGTYDEDNDVVAGTQKGTTNWLNIQMWNLARYNRIMAFLQDGTNNGLKVEQNGASSSTIWSISQKGVLNTAIIRQNGARNEIMSFVQDGNGNGNGVNAELSSGRGAGTRIVQAGNDNKVTLASVVGSNNTQGCCTYAPPQDIRQQGNNNGQTASTASTLGSNGNGIKVSEVGNSNNFSIQQGVATTSTGNWATLTQTGSFNMATVTQYGDGNRIIITQNNNNNTATANFAGDNNADGTLAGVAGALDSSSTSLTKGEIFQSTTGALTNTLTYNVTGSGNKFAFAQLNGTNTITGTVGATGAPSSNNSVAVLQSSSGNNVGFSQTTGNGNIAAISQ